MARYSVYASELKVAAALISVVCGTGCVPYSASPAMPSVTVGPAFDARLYERLAIYVEDRSGEFRSWGRSMGGTLRTVEDEFYRSAMSRGFSLSARSDMDAVAEELKIQHSAVTEDALARMGRAMNVQGLLIVSINNAKTERYQPIVSIQGQQYYLTAVSISARLLDVERSQIVWIGSHEARVPVSGRDAAGEAVARVAGVVARGLPTLVRSQPAPRVEQALRPAPSNPRATGRAVVGQAATPNTRRVALGRLRIDVQPPEAAVWLNGRLIGSGADLAALPEALSVPVGTNKIVAVLVGWGELRREVEVEAVGEVSIALVLGD